MLNMATRFYSTFCLDLCLFGSSVPRTASGLHVLSVVTAPDAAAAAAAATTSDGGSGCAVTPTRGYPTSRTKRQKRRQQNTPQPTDLSTRYNNAYLLHCNY